MDEKIRKVEVNRLTGERSVLVDDQSNQGRQIKEVKPEL
jgi:hypothetical protein